jgi:hypothetical protein
MLPPMLREIFAVDARGEMHELQQRMDAQVHHFCHDEAVYDNGIQGIQGAGPLREGTIPVARYTEHSRNHFTKGKNNGRNGDYK